MKKKYTDEIKMFIEENAPGISTKKLTALVNDAFKTDFTETAIHSFKTKHKIKSGVRIQPYAMEYGTKMFPVEIVRFIVANIEGTGHAEMAEMINSTFGTDYTKEQIKAFYGRYHLSCGLTGRFHPGHIPANKGMKGRFHPCNEETRFKSGNAPHNTLPVGTIKVKDGRYFWTKIAEPNVWKQTHRLIWESVHGPIQDGEIIIFLDGDPTNLDISNLAKVTKAESLTMTRRKTRSANPEITKTAILAARVDCTRRKIEKKKGKNENVSEQEATQKRN